MKGNSPLVSVIIPVYNCEKYLEESISSIINQTYKNMEILITDDCSTDNSYNILMLFAEKDKRIKLFRNNENLKIVKTLNAMISKAQGEFIARMDSDDISLPRRIEEQVNFLQKNESIDICGTNIDYIDKNSVFLRKAHFPKKNDSIQSIKFFRTPFCHPTVMFRKSIKSRVVYKDSFLYAEDYGLWLEILLQSRAANLGQSLLKYRIHDNQISQIHNKIQIDSLIKIYTIYLNDCLSDKQIFDLSTYIVLRQIPSKKEFLKIIFRIIKKRNINMGIEQLFSLFFNILKCRRSK